MPYCTPADVLAELKPRELAEAASADGETLADELVRLVCTGASISGYSDAEQLAAANLLAHVQTRCDAASVEVDGYLALRFGDQLPFTAAPPILKVWALAITRYKLHQHLRILDKKSEAGQHPIHANYERTMQQLAALADGKFSLGANDPKLPKSNQAVMFGNDVSYFDRKARQGGPL